jgi:hypothetical protein
MSYSYDRTATTPTTVEEFIRYMTTTLVKWNLAMQKRGRGFNPYAMGLYLEQVEKIEKDVERVKQSGDPKALEFLKKSIFRRFETDFPPAKRVVKVIDNYLAKQVTPDAR